MSGRGIPLAAAGVLRRGRRKLWDMFGSRGSDEEAEGHG